MRKLRVGYLVSHPIQYQSPLLRQIAALPEIDLRVSYLSDFSARAHRDPGFGARFEWDVPLLEGFESQALTSRDAVEPWAPLVPDVWRRIGGDDLDALWVHGWSQVTQLIAIRAALRRGVPVLLRGESKREHRGVLKRSALARLLRRAAGVLAIGSENRDFYLDLGVDPARVFSMPYAVDNERFERDALCDGARRAALAGELGLDPGRPIVLFASKMIPRKRPLDLVAALRRLSPDGTREPAAQLVLAGDGPERARVERAARETGWRSIVLPGFVNQSRLPALYGLCDVFALPSEYETWGLVLNEAMSAGRPVVTTRGVGAARDLVVDGRTGFVREVGDVAGLADALRRATADPDTVRVMGDAARERVAAFGFESCGRGLLDALREVCR